MNRLLRNLLPAIVGVCIASSAIAAGRLAPGSGDPAPALVLNDLDGREVRLDNFRGRTVVVNFWATWCGPCVAEMPSLSRLRDKLSGVGVEVIGVNLQENAARIRPFAEKLGLDFPIVRDHDGSVTKAWKATVFPTTYVVGPDGRIALVALGEVNWDAPDVAARVRGVASRPGALQKSPRAELFPTPFPKGSLWIAAVS
ncbi:MAG TPA: TlpA disulfide reductase family protein [Casimicrobiaceae bacterium]|nr:TlpA disulfide reductase family protein [Casimicrobiaceae bacterium]